MTLTVEKGSFAYRGGAPILQDIDFSVSSGEILAILGPNGAGKTTLLRCMMNFLRWSGGRCLLDGADIRSIGSRRLWQTISYVPQSRAASTAFTVRETVLLGRTNRIGVFSTPRPADYDAADEIIERLGLTKLAAQTCGEISGGELQMVLIARALAAEPKLLILDEPESNLDFKNQLIVLETLTALAEKGLCCIFNTHYPNHALTRAGKSLLLSGDGTYRFGDTARIVTEQNIETAFGVRAVIGEIETPGNIYKNVLPLELSRGGSTADGASDAGMLAVIAVIFDDFRSGEQINRLFHDYNRYLVGRMGMPYRERGLYIINLTLDAPVGEINTLAHRLSLLPGVNIKTTFAERRRTHSRS